MTFRAVTPFSEVWCSIIWKIVNCPFTFLVHCICQSFRFLIRFLNFSGLMTIHLDTLKVSSLFFHFKSIVRLIHKNSFMSVWSILKLIYASRCLQKDLYKLYSEVEVLIKFCSYRATVRFLMHSHANICRAQNKALLLTSQHSILAILWACAMIENVWYIAQLTLD